MNWSLSVWMLLPLFFAFQPVKLFAQAGCPSVNAGADQNTSCAAPCANLNASYFNVGRTTSYTVVPVPYAPNSFTTGNPVLVNIDDTWTDVIDLTFNFCFFGTMYNKIVVGSNGIISFDTTYANDFCNYDLTMSGGIPDNGLPTNSIMGVYQDIDPTFMGSIYYEIMGVSPCRKFVVTYYDVPYYGDPNSIDPSYCIDPIFATTQIVLYETTNAIDIFSKDKPNCTDWNDGLAIQGIQNATGALAYSVPGRNNTVFSLTNDGYRFLPNGLSIVSFSWLLNGSIIGTNTSIQVCPVTSTTYTAQAVYTACDGTQIIETDNVVVNPVGVVQGTVSVSQQPNCNFPASGALLASGAGGTGPYSYAWSNGATTAAVSGLPAGTYTVSITDASGCSTTKTATLTIPVITATLPVIQDVTCNGGNDGSINVAGTGGALPYSYQWSSGGNTGTINNLTAGNYTCTITDAGGCTVVANATVTEPLALTAAVNVVDVSCFGFSDGSAQLNVSGGTGIFTYAWNTIPVQNTALASNLPANIFSCVVTDAAGCTKTFFATVYEPNLMVVSDLITQPSCTTSVTGDVQISVSGGVGPYSYAWPGHPWTVSTVTSLPPGNYSYVVTDQHGCSDTTFITIQQITPVEITLTKRDVHCYGEQNGNITVVVDSGIAPFNYAWSPPVDTTAALDSLSAGFYSVVVTSAEGCTAMDTISVLQPPMLVVTAQLQPARCCYGEDVLLSASGNGNLVWSNGAVADSLTLTALSSQTYVVTLTDAAGCFDLDSVQLIVDPLPLVSCSADSVCLGSPTHFTNSSSVASGSISSWDWHFDNGSTSPLFAPALVLNHAGNNPVTLIAQTDRGCIDSAGFNARVWTLPVPLLSADKLSGCPPLEILLTSQSTVADGQIDELVWWLDTYTGVSGDSLNVVLMDNGFYDVSLEVTSSYGCISDTTYADYIHAYKMPVADFTYLPSSPSVFLPRVEFYDQSFYADKWFWTFGDSGSVSNDVNPAHVYAVPGEYIVQLVVESDDGCRDTTEMPVIIKNDYALWVPSAFSPNNDGKNETFTVKGFNYSAYQLRVFDRWGELLFESGDPEKGWDGSYQGGSAAEGVYIYVVNYKDIFNEGHTLTGRVTIIH